MHAEWPARMRDLRDEWQLAFVTIAEREDLSIEQAVDVLGSAGGELLRHLWRLTDNAGAPYPSGYIFHCLSLMQHALAHVPQGMDPGLDAWLHVDHQEEDEEE